MKNHKKLISVLLVLALVLTLCVSFAFASTGIVPKNLEYMDLKIKLNGEIITPKDVTGKIVEPFAIEGTTYLPIRAIAGALGLNVGWDGATKTVVLNSPELSATEIFRKCSPSVVHIETNTGGGTGFFIEENIVATNNHVINGAWSATVKTVDGQIFDVVEVLAATENPDLALLRVDGKGAPVTLNTNCAEMGEVLYSIGAPMGIFPTMSTGIVANNTFSENGTNFYLSNINTLSGNSGGPIFNNRGEVVGVMQGGITDGLNSLDMIIKVAHVLEMDRSNPHELTIPAPTEHEKYAIADSLKSAEVGQLVSFGRYEQDGKPETTNEEVLWLVIEKNGSELKLMSLYCLDIIPFMKNSDPVRWENSYAREFLNGEFFNRAFSAAEQAMIKTVAVKNTPNPVYGTGGGADTLDKVYIFSLDEAMEYYNLPAEENFYDGVYAQATIHTIMNGAWLEIPGSNNCWWWLRSTGGNDQNATEIGSRGYLSFNGNTGETELRAIRPIIHIEVK